MGTTLILSPHCDDVPLSLGASLLAKEWGDDIHVAVVFSTSRYTLANSWYNDPQATTATRNAEEMRAAAAASYTVEFLGFPEPGVRPGYTQMADVFDPSRPFEPDPIWKTLRQRLIGILGQHAGVAVSPLGIGHHIDHRMVAACFADAAEMFPGITPAFYEDLPYAARFSSRDIRRLVPNQMQGRGLVPVPLRRGRLADKLELLSVYKSQLSEDDYGSVADHWACRGQAELVWWPEGNP